ncbi:MAG: hypothetical protein NZ903_01165 [Candidatus Micrarchaeota archaeon]|nr:hypothetical protein [Candidatus Micrarchaeota archaeon]
MPEERKPEKKTIKEIVEEAKKAKRLPELVESIAKEIKKAKMSKEEIREIYQEIPKEKIEEYKKIAKAIGIGPTPENIVSLYIQEKPKQEANIMQVIFTNADTIRFFQEALSTAKSIEYDDDRAEALREIARAQASSAKQM